MKFVESKNLLAALLLILSTIPSIAAPPRDEAGKKINPLLAQGCFSMDVLCHHGLVRFGGSVQDVWT